MWFASHNTSGGAAIILCDMLQEPLSGLFLLQHTFLDGLLFRIIQERWLIPLGECVFSFSLEDRVIVVARSLCVISFGEYGLPCNVGYLSHQSSPIIVVFHIFRECDSLCFTILEPFKTVVRAMLQEFLYGLFLLPF